MVETGRGERGHPTREFERHGMRELKGRGEIQFARLPPNGLDDTLAPVAGVDAP